MPHVLTQDGEEIYSLSIRPLLKKQKKLEEEGTSLTSKILHESVMKAQIFNDTELPSEEVQKIVENLEEVFVHVADQGSKLSSNTIPPWVPFSKSAVDWPFWYRYQTLLQRESILSPYDLEQLDEHTDAILEQCGNPKGDSLQADHPHPELWDVRGMVFGNVQMGKTSNYAGVICKAADAGYKVIIVLAGIHENLRMQTQERIDEAFIGRQSVGNPREHFGGASHGHSKWVGVGKITIPGVKSPVVPIWATTRCKGGDFNRRTAKQFGVAIQPNMPPLILVVKKNASVLRSILRWLIPQEHLIEIDSKFSARKRRNIEECMPPFPKTFISDECPLLLIDDEADQASVDTASGGVDDVYGDADKEHDPKVINRLIRSMLRCFPKSSYIGYTATPFANILIHEDAETEQYGPDLFPSDFIHSLHVPNAYIGPDTLFGVRKPVEDEWDRFDSEGLPELIEIVEDHAEPPDDIKATEGWMPPVHRKCHDVGVLPQSLKNALADFVLAGAGLICRGRGDKHQSMLIHVTRFQNVIRQLYQQVQEYWLDWSTQILNGDPEALAFLKKRWNTSFVESFSAVKKQRSWEQGLVRISWSQLIEAPKENWRLSPLQRAASNVSVRQVHGGPEGQALDYSRSEQLRVIAVGGGKLSRGLTLENLTTSYFLRTSRMYDTLMQMGRWFGYRPAYLDLCRIYMPQELSSWFGHISDASAELRVELERMQAQGAKPMDFGLRVRSHPSMQVTSSVKMRYGTKMKLGFADSSPESRTFYTDPDSIRQNWSTLNQFVEKMGPHYTKDIVAERPSKTKNGAAHTKMYRGWAWESVPSRKIVELLSSLRIPHHASVAHAPRMAEYIEHMNRRGELTHWTVFIRDNTDKDNPKDILPFGVEPGRSKRSRKPVEKVASRRGVVDSSVSIYSLSNWDYETVDMDKNAYSTALSKRKQSFSQRDNLRATDPSHWIRRERSSKQGLLLLYTVQLFDRKVYQKDAETGEVLKDSDGSKVLRFAEKRIELHPDLPLVGFTVSFPPSKMKNEDNTIEYVVNNVYDKVFTKEYND